MKLSISWIRNINSTYQCSADPMPDGIDALVEKIGAQLGAVDEVTDLGKLYKGIVAAKIISCEKHPDADQLSVCMIDDGGAVKGVKRNKDGYIQVVCGAPNARATLAVAWIPPGAAVPSTIDKDPLVLEAREIRGVVSNGMLASPKELALGDNHEGILEIDEKVKPGQPFAEVYGLNDYIIDIENKMFTHRPDLFGLLGIARELAGIQGHVFKSPGWYRADAKIPAAKNNRLELKVQNQVPELVPRFCMTAMKHVSVGPSPVWLQTYLSRVGIRPINNVVDITNYIMMVTGQPLHAYDYDKVKTGLVSVRLSKTGETLKLLGGKQIKLEAGAVVITDGERPIGLGGVMGGAETEVDENTQNIILEAGSFDMNLTRKTAMAYGLFTDAATRFSKNQSARQNLAALERAVASVEELAGGRVASGLFDLKHKSVKANAPVVLSTVFINQRLGLNLSGSQIKKLLENVEFEVSGPDQKLSVTAPFWRTDIEIAEDVVEEVGRLYGYDHLPVELPRKGISPVPADDLLEFKGRLRQALRRDGGNEVLTYSFVHSSLLSAAGQDQKKAFHIRNALSPDLQYYRLSLVPSMLDKVHANIKAGFDEFCLFEIGRGHVKGINDDQNLPAGLERLGVVIASKHKPDGAAYYWAKSYLENLALNELYVIDLSYLPLAEANDLPSQWRIAAEAYEPARSAAVYAGGQPLGLLGEPSDRLRSVLKLPKTAAQFELDIARLLELTPAVKPYFSLNRFPAVEQDITLKVKAGLSYADITSYMMSALDAEGQDRGYLSMWRPLDIYQKPGREAHKHITWRIILSHPERTLTTEETNKLLDDAAAKAELKFGAERI